MTTPEDAVGREASTSHLRFAYRARKALDQLREQIDIVDVNREDPIPESAGPGGFVGDFVVGALDVRMLIVLRAEVRDPQQLHAGELHEEAIVALERAPEVDALALVANDEAMTTLIFEVFDRPETVRVPAGTPSYERPAVGPSPLVEAVNEYLALFRLDWSVVGDLPTVELVDSRERAAAAAQDALAGIRGRRYGVPAKVTARDALADEDATWAAELALRLYGAGVEDLEGEIDRRSGGGR